MKCTHESSRKHANRLMIWLFRRLQYLIEDVDAWFASPGPAPLPAPISTLRIDFDNDFLHKQNGLGLSSASSFEASLSVPNLVLGICREGQPQEPSLD